VGVLLFFSRSVDHKLLLASDHEQVSIRGGVVDIRTRRGYFVHF
jgi:hypothetical protein